MFSCLCATLPTIGIARSETGRTPWAGRGLFSPFEQRPGPNLDLCKYGTRRIWIGFDAKRCRATYVVEKRFGDREHRTQAQRMPPKPPLPTVNELRPRDRVRAKRSTYVRSTWVRRTRSCRSHRSTNSIVPRTSRGCRTCLACTFCWVLHTRKRQWDAKKKMNEKAARSDGSEIPLLSRIHASDNTW